MKFLIRYILGYTLIKTCGESVKDLLNFANKNHIKIISVNKSGAYAFVKIFTKDEQQFSKFLSVSYFEIVCRKGLCRFLKKYLHRVGILLGIILFFASLCLSPLFVWEINVSGLENLTYEYVLSLLEDEGVRIGTFAPLVDREKVYVNVLKKTNSISWIAVNFTGSSANIEIVERDNHGGVIKNADGANIIASKDGQIVEMDIVTGKAVVTQGSVIKKGELIVSGIFDSEMKGTHIVYSNAKVLAKVTDVYCAEISLENSKRKYEDEKIAEISFKMFGKSINIFKNYSNYNNSYDIILRDNIIMLSETQMLPFSIVSTVIVPYKEERISLTEEEALGLAKQKVFVDISGNASYVEILGTEESYTVENGILKYICSVEAIENIAAVSEFWFDNR